MKHKQMVEIEVGGFVRRLRYDFNAIASLEEAIDRPVSALGDNVGVRELRAMLWAGLIHELPKLTIVQAGDMISFEKNGIHHREDPGSIRARDGSKW